MTIKDYILQKFSAFGTISEAELLDMSIAGQFSLDDEYTRDNVNVVGVASIRFIEEKVFAPTLKSVSESGFSASWDFSNMGKYYLYLCRKFNIEPDKNVLEQIGISAIFDKTDIW